MDYRMKDDIILSSYESLTEMKKVILKFIIKEDSEKILFKGDPKDINYKLLKKILPNKNNHNINELNVEESKNIREVYNNFINRIHCKNCLIYKK
jgi:hypothetical protein